MLRGNTYAFEQPHYRCLLADPEIFQQNRLPFHAHFADQTSPEMPLTVSLDGEWAFRYAENLTAPFSDWDTLTVPGFIQMQSLQKTGQPYGALITSTPSTRGTAMKSCTPARSRRTITHRGVSAQLYPAGKLGKLLPAPERCRQRRRRLVQRHLHRLHRGYLHPGGI